MQIPSIDKFLWLEICQLMKTLISRNLPAMEAVQDLLDYLKMDQKALQWHHWAH